jgi:prolyl oligopeptidase
MAYHGAVRLVPSLNTLFGLAAFSLSLSAFSVQQCHADNEDPYRWLESHTDRTYQWILQQDERTEAIIWASPGFDQLYDRLLELTTSPQRVPYVTNHGGVLFNFWQDADHVRGVWRRTTLTEYRKSEPKWETVLDLDALDSAEKKKWVFRGGTFLQPSNDRCLVRLSLGGADGTIVREFDLTTKQFVADGFNIMRPGNEANWIDRDTLHVVRNFGPESLTATNRDRLIKEWKRGTPLAAAPTIFEADANDQGSVTFGLYRGEKELHEVAIRQVTLNGTEEYLRVGDNWVHLEKPSDALLSIFKGFLLLTLKSDWDTGGEHFRAGSLIAEKLDAFLAGDRTFAALFEPGEKRTLKSYYFTRNYLLLSVLDKDSARVLELLPDDGGWRNETVEVPSFGAVSLNPIDPHASDEYFLTTDDFLTPPSIYLCTAGSKDSELIKREPARFNAAKLRTRQFEAKSADGTLIPYFEVGPERMALDGKNPTILAGYGGFDVAEVPSYRPGIGAGWLERGGVYVLANIRGGGEFGPSWHDAAVKEHRQRSYDDFIAVAQDLVDRKVTSPRHLGVVGASNGGLLAGVVMVERPELFGAVVGISPLLDMRAYTRLLYGAMWENEYGDPNNPADWAYMSKYSPYQNVSKNRTYPAALFLTSINDNRVDPSHSRKMTAKMEDEGHTVLYFESGEGGHSLATTWRDAAGFGAMTYTFLWNELK